MAARWSTVGTMPPVVTPVVNSAHSKPLSSRGPSCSWSSRRDNAGMAMRLLLHEQDGPRLLNGFEWALLTTGVTTAGIVPTVDHLAAIPGELGAALLEIPLRDGGYLLPSWEELEAFSRACSDRGVPLHLDGARIWESAPFLGHSPAEIAALADTVYVSFYKGLRGLCPR